MPIGVRWSSDDRAEFKKLYESGAPESEWQERFPGRSLGSFQGQIILGQFHRPLHPERVKGFNPSHPRIVAGHTIHQSRVVNPKNSVNGVIMPGKNQRKLGSRVTVGKWKGMAIYSLTLEERATCPTTCHHWTTCMGNGMQVAKRYEHGIDLENALDDELYALNVLHPEGFVVRLHILGDFYSVEYVKRWAEWLHEYPNLHVFGYTAWPANTPIGREVRRLTNARWHRFAIRTSTTELRGRQRAITGWTWPYKTRTNEIVCLVQSKKARDCGSCGLCWLSTIRDRAIVFIAHGR